MALALMEGVISSLEQEIASLKEQYQTNQSEISSLSSSSVTYSLQPSQDDSIEGFPALTKNINTQLAHGDTEIHFFTDISGIEILHYFKKPEQKGEKAFQRHKMAARCRFLPFEVTFVTLETQIDGRWACDVTEVKVVMDCAGYPELSKLVGRTEATMDLLGFFRTLAKYVEWCEFRKKTFAHLKERYAAAVRLPHGSASSHMVLVNPQLPQCQMILVWEITMSNGGAVVPVLDLLPKLPEEAIALDKAAVVEEAAAAFKNLLRVFGIQGSIEKIIHAFCLRNTYDKRGSE